MELPNLMIFNSISQKKEPFVPNNYPNVGMYTCGPTIYNYPTIGNWRTYTLGDVVFRTLVFLDYKPKYIMNLTDVGHLSGDNLGDSSQGEDRMAKAAEKENVDAWAIANKYETDFIESFPLLNLIKPELFCKATDHIKEQIDLIKRIEEKGLTYKTSDGLYFDVQKYESLGNKYGELSNIDYIDPGKTRIAHNDEKKDSRDFALWKFFATGQKRHNMEWESPWGTGFPGWHIECSAMSMKYLGDTFDLHLGGEDLKSTHHPNEIAQSESATGKKPFVKYWIHGAFLQVDGGRMGKSLGNAYTLHDVLNKGYSPLDLRYFYLSGKYSSHINFTWANLDSAKSAREKLVGKTAELLKTTNGVKAFTDSTYYKLFVQSISDDFNIPKALAVMWDVLNDQNIDTYEQISLVLKFDEVFGLKLKEEAEKQLADDDKQIEIPEEVKELAKQRWEAKQNKDFATSDELRKKVIDLGYNILDEEKGYKLEKK